MEGHLGEFLKINREKRGWNQAAMAEFLGVSLRTYHDIEKTGIVTKSEVMKRIRVFFKAERPEDVQEIAEPPAQFESKQNPFKEKYIELLERNNKTLERSIQLSLNAILEGQSGLRTFVDQNFQESHNRALQLMRSVAEIRDHRGSSSRPAKVTTGRNVLPGKRADVIDRGKGTDNRGKN